ncbi:hypothetical protein C8F01DRAFT_1272127 [Mycena amicta]|nr:hypothetical protein C8F01DRAFT_1272127 [Mycena amicta]
MASAESSRTAHWNKIRACVNCKKRKIKCDMVKPKCGPCLRSMNFQDCEYVSEGITTVQHLEHQIAGVEARIRGLDVPRSMQPYSVATPLSHSPASRASTQFREISSNVMERMIAYFLDRARVQAGFFLDIDRTTAAVMSPALFSVVRLWSIHLSRSESTTPTPEHEFETPYLDRALRAMGDALTHAPSGNHPQAILHTIQAHVLLANYFFRNMRFLEGKYHLASAVGLVVGAGMYKRKHSTPERVTAFWTVYAMDCYWPITDGSVSNFPPEIQSGIDVPWPNDPSGSHEEQGTITTFLDLTLTSASNANANPGTSQTLHAKAAILYEHAARLIAQYQPQMSREDHHHFTLAFTTIDALIQRFRESLRRFTQHRQDSTYYQLALVLVCAATIQLHTPFAFVVRPDAEMSRRRVLDAARDIVASFEGVQQPEPMDPIMGPLLTTTHRVFISAIVFTRSRPQVRQDHSSESEPALRSAAERVLAIMDGLARWCKLFDAQLNTMREAYRSLR